MLRIVLLGTGNVAKQLFDALTLQKEINVVQVYGRRPGSLSYFEGKTEVTSKISEIKEADILIMAISDDAIPTFAKRLQHLKGLLVHTAGSVPLDALPQTLRGGVFYPLQTFTAGSTIDFKEIPICIEARSASDLELLKRMARGLSTKVFQIDSKQRKSLHLAAVFANNFSNHMYFAAQQICLENAVPFELLHPLIKETAVKATTISPYDAQTGPARRNNLAVLENQQDQLTDKRLKELYSLVSKSIQKTYGEKL